MHTTIESQVRSFIVDHFLFGKGGESLRGSDSFMDKGILDSTGVLEVVGFLEDTWGIDVKDDELVPDNLDTIDRLVSFIERKRAR